MVVKAESSSGEMHLLLIKSYRQQAFNCSKSKMETTEQKVKVSNKDARMILIT